MDIRNFFAPTKSTVPVSKPQSSSTSAEKQPRQKKKSVPKTASPKSDEKPPGKGKKRVILDSDSDEEKKEERKPRKKSPKERERVEPVKRKDPIAYVSDTDSDNDAFVSLKASKHNSFAKAAKDADKGGFRPSPVTPPSNPSPQQTGKGEVKSPFSPAPPKSVPPQHKATPTSVLDYFGTSSVQRSDKKLVARTGSTGSTKRKAPTEDPEGSCHDEVMARRLQMEEDMELERQIHEDADFARTLAMLEEDAPQFKKARVESEGKSESGPSLSKSSSNQANSRDTKMCQAKSLSPKKSPSKSSAKLALLKRKAEQGVEKRRERTDAESGRTGLTPQRAPAMPSSSESAATPKSGSVTAPKTKMSPVKSETSPEEGEKKRQNSAAFRSYLNRDGPRALGSKEIPQGAENCLEGLTFVLTGVLESMERDDAKSLIERHGGKVTGNISRKTSYLVIGRDSGVSKTEKAEALGTKLINEDELLELVRSKPGRKSKYETAAETEAKATRPGAPPSSAQSRSPRKSSPCLRKPAGGQAATSVASAGPPTSGSGEDGANMLWVDKYRPRSLRNLIGQQGEQSCANKLLRWLQNWHSHHGNSAKAPPARAFGRFGGRDDGSGFKAALLSGPPGVGKTTSAALVCEEVGYSYVEMNASSTRSKNSLRDVIAESLNNTSIKTFYTGESQTVSSKHVLIMDEVDGMAGNEDRGGMQELIGLIKQTKIPIICMCNDRNQQKIRSLANYCFDLRYQRPRLEQIKGAMMSIAFKEGLKIPPPALNEIILASNQDVRQVLHNLSMWSAKDKVMTYDQAKADAKNARKDMKMGPFDVCRKVFAAGEETAHMSLIDKSDLFFHDYSLSPLFVQENYIHVRPAAAGGNLKSHLVLLSKAADSISDGDLVDKQIRSRQTWSLLPTQAIYASVLPGELMRGYLSQFPSFPSWLGRFSSRGKQSRILQELTSHMSLRTLSSKEAVNMDYVPYLRSALLNPLFSRGTEGAPHTVQLMDDYNIIREDLENIMEISSWGGQPDPYSKLDPKVKAALTRAYNKESHLTPYSLQAVKKGRRTNPEPDLGGHDPDHNNPLEEEEEEGMISDGMIKQKKPKAIKESKPEKAGDSGKGKGKAGDSGKDKGKAGDSGKGKGKGKGRR